MHPSGVSLSIIGMELVIKFSLFIYSYVIPRRGSNTQVQSVTISNRA